MFATELKHPVQFGAGMHGGEVIIGDISFRDHTVFTALGDAVGVAARLQDLTKTLNCTSSSRMRSTRTRASPGRSSIGQTADPRPRSADDGAHGRRSDRTRNRAQRAGRVRGR
jgi:class 3 adenylate cyclase